MSSKKFIVRCDDNAGSSWIEKEFNTFEEAKDFVEEEVSSCQEVSERAQFHEITRFYIYEDYILKVDEEGDAEFNNPIYESRAVYVDEALR